MKKKTKAKIRKRLQIAFWVVFAVGCGWVALAPHTHRGPSPSITVKVQQPVPKVPEAEVVPKEIPLPPPDLLWEEPRVTPPAEGVTVPVVPEVHKPLPVGHALKIAIVIDDVGVDLKGSERAIRLPAAVTLSFLPYGARLRDQTREAREAGHELLLHMPMEPVGHENPGPGALLVALPLDEAQSRFEMALASFTGFDGVNNHMGSKFTASPEGMGMVVDELLQRQLFFLDSKTSAQSVGKKVADEKGLPAIARDVFLDDDQSPEVIRAQLEATERVARRKGYAVAIGHPHVATLEALEGWTAEVQRRGFELVPLHDLVKGE